jgi:hypothetical protein
MTVIALPVKWLGLAPTATDRAVSDEAQRFRRDRWLSVDTGFSLSVEEPYRRATAAVIEAAQEANRPNWDGQGGLPVTQGAVAQAFAFLDVLPSTLSEPEVAVDPDGEFSFEWSFGPRRALTASISASGKISFAALIGPARLYGTDYLLDALPEPLTLALRQLHASAA